ncbi:MAG TPA: hypothetical protein ENJ16_05995 [Planctomycetaceae bacterium]|nr:hypothetical protein [Planctomycetaceae bacterium]
MTARGMRVIMNGNFALAIWPTLHDRGTPLPRPQNPESDGHLARPTGTESAQRHSREALMEANSSVRTITELLRRDLLVAFCLHRTSDTPSFVTRCAQLLAKKRLY